MDTSLFFILFLRNREDNFATVRGSYFERIPVQTKACRFIKAQY